MPRQQATGQSWVRFGSQPGAQDVPGGIVEIFTNANGANLLVGDAVYISAASSVAKSIAAGNQGKPAGIVVGGTATGMECSDDPADVGAVAAANGDQVLVLMSGKAYVTTDGATAAGVAICMSVTTAGRVRAFGALAIAAGAVAVTSAAANGATDITGDGPNTIIGIMKQATAGAAVGLALISCV